MLRKLVIVLATGLIATSALAGDDANVVKSYELKDGATLFIYKDGKMGMEDQAGRTVRMKEGEVMETRDGEKIMMKGNELWRVERRHVIHRGG